MKVVTEYSVVVPGPYVIFSRATTSTFHESKKKVAITIKRCPLEKLMET